MSIVVLGVNYHTSPVTLLEKVMIPVPAMSEALRVLSNHSDIREVVVLSTCNRTEVYAVAERFHGAHADILEFLCETSGLSSDEITPHLYSQFDDDAVVHLFEVAAGIDSAVLGETEIVGQVRDAWDFAMKQGTSRSTLNLLFRYALESGKRARTETGISRSTASVAHAAVEMAEEILGTLSGKRVLVVGAGEMGEGVAGALSRAGTESITVLNRTVSRAEALAEKIGKLPKVVIPVHLCGQPCDMAGIHALSQQYGFKIIEDASHAHGASKDGVPCGRMGDVSVFSLQGDKLVPAGEGGVLMTDDDATYDRALCMGDITRIIRMPTADRRFAATSFGIKTRIAPMSGA